MKKFLLPFFTLLLLHIAPLAKSQGFPFASSGGASSADNATDLVTLPSGNILFAGHVGSQTSVKQAHFQQVNFTIDGQTDGYLAKTTTAGNAVFFKKIGTFGNQYIKALAYGNIGSAFVGGSTDTTLVIDAITSINSTNSFFIAQLDTLGNANWIFTADSCFSRKPVEVVDLATSGTNVIAIVNFSDSIYVNNVKYKTGVQVNSLVISLSNTGTVNWVVPLISSVAVGATSVTVDGAQNVYVGGSFRANFNIGSFSGNSLGGVDAFLLKINSAGLPVGFEQFGGVNADRVTTLDVKDSLLAVGGYSESFFFYTNKVLPNAGSHDGLIALFDTSLTPIWMNTFGGSSQDIVTSISIDDSLNIGVAGYSDGHAGIFGNILLTFKRTPYVLITDSAGALLDYTPLDTNRPRVINALNLINRNKINLVGTFVGPTELPGAPQLTNYGTIDFFVAQWRNCDGKFQVNATIIGNDTVCQPDSVMIAANFDPNVTYQWYKIGNKLSNKTNSVFFAKESSNFQVISNDFGCLDTSLQVAANILPQPFVFYYDFPVLCSTGDSLNLLTYAEPYGGSFSGPGVFNNKFGPSIGPGNYPITYTITNSFNCTSTPSKDITVSLTPNVLLGNLPTICSFDTTYKFNEGIPAGGIYSGIGVFENRFNPAVGLGQYKIKYHYTDTFGCGGVDSNFIRVDTLPKITFTKNNKLCLRGGLVNLNTALPAGGEYLGGIVNNGVVNPANIGVGSHIYWYRFTGSNGCVNTQNDSLKVVPGPSPQLVDSVELCFKTPLELKLNENFTSYKWENGSTDQTLYIKGENLSVGSKYFNVTVTDDLGCPGFDSTFVEINYCTTVSASPNPAKANLQVSINSFDNATARLFLIDLKGVKHIDKQVVLSPGTNNYQIDLRHVYGGLYTLMVEFDSYFLHQRVVILNENK